MIVFTASVVVFGALVGWRGRSLTRPPARVSADGPAAIVRRPHAVAFASAALERRRRSRAAPAYAELLEELARRCATGDTLAHAYGQARAAVSPPFDIAHHHLSAGATVDEAFGLQTAVDADAALTIHVIRLCAQLGGPMPEFLDRAAATLRERQAVRDERASQSAQALLSARVLTITPLAFGAWTLLGSSSVQRFMITPAGVGCVTSGVALNIVGWRWMRQRIGVR